MLEYNADEFLGFNEDKNEEFSEEVNKKVSFLYDSYMLTRRYHKTQPDEREEAVRKMLSDYNSSILMDNAIRGILVGDYTLNDLLKRKGYLK